MSGCCLLDSVLDFDQLGMSRSQVDLFFLNGVGEEDVVGLLAFLEDEDANRDFGVDTI
jgi:hypothetical protein